MKPEYAAAGLQGGGLSSAVVTDKAENLTRRDVQAQIIHGGLCAVGFGKMFNPEHMRYLSCILEWQHHTTRSAAPQVLLKN